MFTRSKWAIPKEDYKMAHVQFHPDEIANGHVLKKNIFLDVFCCLFGWHMFLSGRRVLVTVLNEYKLFPRSRDDETIINTPI
jgi:hypothetical protein